MANPTTHGITLINTSMASTSYNSKDQATIGIVKGANASHGGCFYMYRAYSYGTRNHKATYNAYVYRSYQDKTRITIKGNSTGSGTEQLMFSGVIGISQGNLPKSTFGAWALSNNAKPSSIRIKYEHYKLTETYLEYDTSKGVVYTPYLPCAYVYHPIFYGMLGCRLRFSTGDVYIDSEHTDAQGRWKVDRAQIAGLGMYDFDKIPELFIEVPKKTNRNIRILCDSNARNKVDVTYKMYTLFDDFDDNGAELDSTTLLSNVLDTKNMGDGDRVIIQLPNIRFMLNGEIRDNGSITISKSDEFRLVHPKLKPSTFIEYSILAGNIELLWKING